MLNKSVCKKCVNECKSYFTWDDAEDEAWDDYKYVWCVYKVRKIFLHKNTEPPDKCRYKLEHMVLGDDVD